VSARYPHTFYGQLGAKKIGLFGRVPLSMNVTGARDANFEQRPLAKAVNWFESAGESGHAQRFLRQLTDNATTEAEFTGAAALSEKHGYTHVAIQVIQEMERDLDKRSIEFLYPTLKNAETYIQEMEPAAVHGIVRQESRFNSTAVSHAGARGLMQLMPATAKEVAGKKGVSHQLEWLTQRPDHNIRLGSSYLAQMVRRYDGHYALAAAAYNAGPGRVDRWLVEIGDPRKGEIALLDWAELIPIYETRNYVQRVLEGTVVYRQLLKDNTPTGITHMDAP
jgi:soluble lytic murein transglycosylase